MSSPVATAIPFRCLDLEADASEHERREAKPLERARVLCRLSTLARIGSRLSPRYGVCLRETWRHGKPK